MHHFIGSNASCSLKVSLIFEIFNVFVPLPVLCVCGFLSLKHLHIFAIKVFFSEGKKQKNASSQLANVCMISTVRKTVKQLCLALRGWIFQSRLKWMEAKNMIFEAWKNMKMSLFFMIIIVLCNLGRKGYFGKKMLKKICHFKINYLPLSNFFLVEIINLIASAQKNIQF